MLDSFMPPTAEIVKNTLVFTSVGDLFMFIGLLVCIGAIGVYAAYRIWRDFFYD